jgi:hypothetical protein
MCVDSAGSLFYLTAVCCHFLLLLHCVCVGGVNAINGLTASDNQ